MAVRHWPEYAIESAGLALFMLSAILFTILLEHPASPVRQAIAGDVLRRALTGIAMGLTAAAIIYSPWGQRSGAHLNPSVTLTYWRLGKIEAGDARAYIVAQFAGAAAGVLVGVLAAYRLVADPAVNFVATVPGRLGVPAAFAGEALISFVLMLTILSLSNAERVARFTGLVAAALIAAYITVEAPLSGMSMNPARSLAPALAAGALGTVWLYFAAPPAGMLLAAELYLRLRGRHAIRCAKLHHPHGRACHFICRHGEVSA